jgi:hypothetical protein
MSPEHFDQRDFRRLVATTSDGRHYFRAFGLRVDIRHCDGMMRLRQKKIKLVCKIDNRMLKFAVRWIPSESLSNPSRNP